MPTSTDEAIATVVAGSAHTAGAEISVTGSQTASLYVENPTGSGKNVLVPSFSVNVDSATDLLVEFVVGATSTGTTQAWTNHLIGGGSPSAVCKAGQGVLSGGTVQSPKLRVNNSAPFKFEGLPFLLVPGQKAAVRVTGPAGISTALVSMNATILET